MRSNIPRPDEPILKIGPDGKPTFLLNTTWYRFLANLLGDASLTEVTADAGLTEPLPNLQPIQTSLNETRKLAVQALEAESRGDINALMRRVKMLEALVLGARQSASAPGTSSSAGATLANTHIFVGNASNVAADVAMSGDTTIANTGAVTIGANKVTEAKQLLVDNTTWDVSTSQHGYAPKAPNDATQFLNGTGAYSTPSASAGGALSLINSATPTGTGVVTFSSIPGTYKHLLILGSGRSTAGSSPGVNVGLTLNNDTGANYDVMQWQLNNATGGTNSQAAQTSVPSAGFVPWSAATAGNTGNFRIMILNYALTTLFKGGLTEAVSIGATTIGASLVVRNGGFLWRSAAAVTRCDLTLATPDWAAGSAMSIYGVS